MCLPPPGARLVLRAVPVQPLHAPGQPDLRRSAGLRVRRGPPLPRRELPPVGGCQEHRGRRSLRGVLDPSPSDEEWPKGGIDESEGRSCWWSRTLRSGTSSEDGWRTTATTCSPAGDPRLLTTRASAEKGALPPRRPVGLVIVDLWLAGHRGFTVPRRLTSLATSCQRARRSSPSAMAASPSDCSWMITWSPWTGIPIWHPLESKRLVLSTSS
jgi:hypothetical protein